MKVLEKVDEFLKIYLRKSALNLAQSNQWKQGKHTRFIDVFHKNIALCPTVDRIEPNSNDWINKIDRYVKIIDGTFYQRKLRVRGLARRANFWIGVLFLQKGFVKEIFCSLN